MADNDSGGDVNINVNADTSDASSSVQSLADRFADLKVQLDRMSAGVGDQSAAWSSFVDATSGTAAGLDKAGDAAKKAHLNMSLFARELVTVGREAGEGRFTYLAGSLTILGRAVGVSNIAMLGFAAALAAIVVPLAVVGYQFVAAEKESENFNNALKATGNYAGITSSQFYEMSSGVAQESHRSSSSIRELGLQAIESGKITGSSLGAIVFDAAKMSEALGIKAPEAMKILISMTGDVAKKSAELNDQLHFLTETQWLDIRAMEEAGNKSGAMGAALDALKTHLQGVNSDAKGLTWVFQQLGAGIDSVIEKLRTEGRLATGTANYKDLIGDQETKRAQYALNLGNDSPGLKQFDDKIAYYKKQEAAQEAAASQQAKADAYQQQGIELDQRDGKQKSELQQVQDDLSISQQRLAIARRVAAGETSILITKEQALKELQSGSDQANINRENLRIAQIKKAMAGPQGHSGAPSETLNAQNALDKELASMDGSSKAELLQAEIDFWSKREAAINRGVKGGQKLWEEEDNKRLSAQVKLNALLQSEQDKADAKADETAKKVQEENIKGDKEVADLQIKAQLDADEAGVTSQIEALKTKLDDQKKYSAKSLQEYKDLQEKLANIKVASALNKEQETSSSAQQEFDAAATTGDNGGADPEAQAAALNKMKVAWAQYNLDIAEIYKTTNTAINAETNKSVQEQVAAYKASAQKIGDSFRTMLEGLIEKTTSWSQIWIDLQRKALDFVLRGLEQMVVSHLVANEQKVASDKVAAAQSGQISFDQTIGGIKNDALKAWSGAYAATVGIPVVGPILAPVAGAAAFAAVAAMEAGAALFSAAGGMGQVPYDNAPFLLHKNEMVLPANLANPLRNMLSGGSSSTSTTNNGNTIGNMNIHVHPAPGESGQSVVQSIRTAFRQNQFITAGA